MTRIYPLLEICTARLAEARRSTDARSSVSLHDGHDSVLRQTVTALVAQARMEIEHPPDEAWVLVLDGRITLGTGDGRSDGQTAGPGDLIQLRPVPQTITADEDSMLLLMVAKGERPT